MTLRQRWKQTSLPNKLLIWTGVLVAVGTLFYAGAAVVQVCLMKQATKESAAQVDRLVGTTNAAIDKSVQASNKSLADALRQNREALDAAMTRYKTSLDISTQQSKAALDASIEASRNDQRAWLAIADLRVIKEPAASEQFSVNYSVSNSGKTPALEATAKNMIAFDTSEPTPPNWSTVAEVGRGVIFPNTISRDLIESLEASKMTKPVVDAYNNRVSRLYLRTRVDYVDVFGTSHWSENCSVHAFGDAADHWLSCAMGGNIDTYSSGKTGKKK
jgi:hypothetical protein